MLHGRTLINPVNCAGVMGAGLALAFKQLYPAMFDEYRAECEIGRLIPGYLHLWVSPEGRRIINFPTKRHWSDKSTYEDVNDGIYTLRQYLIENPNLVVAIPALGCGLGGLKWSRVSDMLTAQLSDVPAKILLFPPQRR